MATLDIDDVLSLEYPGAPSWSADGRYVAAVVEEPDGDAVLFGDPAGDERWRYRPAEGDAVAAVAWRPTGAACLVAAGDGRVALVDPDAETARTVATGPEAHHAWAPDGDRTAFYRAGTPCVREVDGGATRTLDVPDGSRFKPDDRMLAWSPDGRLLAYRFAREDAKHVGVVDVDAGDLVWRTTGPGSSRSPLWLSTEALLFERSSDHARRRELVRAEPTAGTTTILLEETDARAGAFLRASPVLAPDRSRLALPLPLDGWPHLYLLDPETGALDQLTAGDFEDTGVAGDAPRWLDDRSLVFSTNRNAPERRDVYRVDAATGAVEPVVRTPGTNVFPRPSPDGTRVAYLHADRERSPELRVRPVDADPERASPATRLTRSAVADWPVDPFAPERVTLDTEDGVDVPALLVDPHGADATADEYPGLVWVHGGPMRQMRDGWHPTRAYGIAYAVHQLLASSGVVGLLVNYRGGIGYGHGFRQGIAAAPGREVDDDVAAAGEYLASLAHVDADAVGVWGLSYGGYATLRVLGTRPEVFDLGVSIAGVADRRAYADWATDAKRPAPEFRYPTLLGGTRWEAPDAWTAASPVTVVDRYEAPLHTFHGTADGDVHPAQQDHLVDALLAADAAFEAEYYPGEGHVFRSRAVWARTVEKLQAAVDSELR